MGWTFYDSSGRKLNTASTLIDNLDIDGATDIGAAIVDADLFIVDDGAGGTNRKTAASRLKTYAGTTQAVQSDIEAETNQDTYVPPDLMKHHPGVAKAWIRLSVDSGTPAILSSYNMTGVTDQGVGSYRLTIASDFSSDDDAVPFGQALENNSANTAYIVTCDQVSLGITDMHVQTHDNTFQDEWSQMIWFGEQ